MTVPADRFDEIRRKWIARNQRTFIFQKRRAELLARQIRDRDTKRTGARVDTADDDVIHPWYVRPVKTPYAMLDWAILMTGAVMAPIGWPVGKARCTGREAPSGIRTSWRNRYPLKHCAPSAVSLSSWLSLRDALTHIRQL